METFKIALRLFHR